MGCFVSLLLSVIDLIFELGFGEQLFGVSYCCDYFGVVSLLVLMCSIIGFDLLQVEIDCVVSEVVCVGWVLYMVDGLLLDRFWFDFVVIQGVCEVCVVMFGMVVEVVWFFFGCLFVEQVLSLEGKIFVGIFVDLWVLVWVVGVWECGEVLVVELEWCWNVIWFVGVQVLELFCVFMLEWVDLFFYGGYWVFEQVVQVGGKDVLGYVGCDSGCMSWEDVV